MARGQTSGKGGRAQKGEPDHQELEKLRRQLAANNRELAEAKRELADERAQRGATAEILRSIASTPADPQKALDKIADAAARMFGASSVGIRRIEADVFRFVSAAGPEANAVRVRLPDLAVEDRHLVGRCALEARQISVEDARTAELAESDETADYIRETQVRSMALTPLVRAGAVLGVMIVNRGEVQPFQSKELELMTGFADQAVIAIENARLLAELRKSLDNQTASADILRTIAASPSDAMRALDEIARTTARLFGASGATIRTVHDGKLRVAGTSGPAGDRIRAAIGDEFPLAPDTLPGITILEKRQIHVPDLGNPGPLVRNLPGLPANRAAGTRSMASTPLMRKGEAIGALMVQRRELRPFSTDELVQLSGFADQAVIAIENARLLTELRESLDRRTAIAEVLQVISASPGDVQPVFEAMLENAVRLCDAWNGAVFRVEGDLFRRVTSVNLPPELAAQAELRFPPDFPAARMLASKSTVHILDVMSELAERPDHPTLRMAAERTGARSALWVPMVKDGEVVAAFVLSRAEARAFTDSQIGLVESFASQAVIAIENARLLEELNTRNNDLAESLEQQTASADILRAIASAPDDAESVLQAIADTAHRLFGGHHCAIGRLKDGMFRQAAVSGMSREVLADRAAGMRLRRDSLWGIAVLDRRVVHIDDFQASRAALSASPSRFVVETRSAAAAPLIRESEAIGAIIVVRDEVQPFTEKELELLKSFADQAVIAIENARLLAELREALENQTASTEILRAIASAPAEAAQALSTIAQVTARLFTASTVNIHRVEGDRAPLIGGAGPAYDRIRALNFRAGPSIIEPDSVPGAVILEKRQIQVPDVENPDPSMAHWRGVQASRAAGTRSVVGTPLMRQGEAIGALVVHRSEAHAFTDRELAQLTNFADQAVIAIENARLLGELREARDEAQRALVDLRAAQANLIQAEKMASLGQLTAGIAHEIKNPLNFVNNFAGLSIELLDELKESQAAAAAVLDADKRAEIDEIAGMLTSNLEKIAEHGRRADGIVKSMLAHSRSGSGEREEVNLNGLIEEALNLAYHGARAQDQEFTITLERDLDPALSPIEVVPQDLTRVFLNLFGNGFYAASKRRKEADGSFIPKLKVATRDLGAEVEIRIRDNGIGIAPEIRDKLFQPFFTTKPTGEGTGLGLSISYEIVTREHGGTIEVESEPSEFSEFTVTIPKRFGAGIAPE